MSFKLFFQKNFRSILIFSALVAVVGVGYFLSPVFNNREQLQKIDQSPPLQGEEQERKNSAVDAQLKEKIGQMLIIGFRAVEFQDDSFIGRALKELKPGGVVLFDFDVPSRTFPRNIVNPQQVKNLITELQKNSTIPLYVAVDAEGGLVNRLKKQYGFLDVPSAHQMGEKSPQQTEEIARNFGKELCELGFNFDFAPVVDVNVNPQNPIIGKLERSFSGEPQNVIEHAEAFIRGLEEYKIITSLKHFPGHGSSQTDSHKGIADITKSYKTQELWPFQELIKNGLAKTVMVAHVINRNIDSQYPATFSRIFIQQILKQDLGFQGVVVCDDLQMAAIAQDYDPKVSAVKMIAAGCDLLIISNNIATYDEQMPYQVRDAILKAVEDGVIAESNINESFTKIQALKKEFDIIKP